jgi:hypothetical protein
VRQSHADHSGAAEAKRAIRGGWATELVRSSSAANLAARFRVFPPRLRQLATVAEPSRPATMRRAASLHARHGIDGQGGRISEYRVCFRFLSKQYNHWPIAIVLSDLSTRVPHILRAPTFDHSSIREACSMRANQIERAWDM